MTAETIAKALEEYEARMKVDNDPVIGTEAVKKYRPKAVDNAPESDDIDFDV